MKTEIQLPDFGDHHVGDDCKISGSLIEIFRDYERVTSFRLDPWYSLRRTISMLSRVELVKKNRQLLVDFILRGGTQKEPLSVYTAPSAFDANQQPEGTILRCYGEKHEFSRDIPEADNDPYHDMAYLKALVVVYKEKGEKFVLGFFGTEEEIVKESFQYNCDLFGGSQVELGKWFHRVTPVRALSVHPLNRQQSLYDDFVATTGVEILHVGQDVREKAKFIIQNPFKRLSFNPGSSWSNSI